MTYTEKHIVLKDGRSALFRLPHPDDAPELLRYLKQTAGETHFLLRTPEECVMTLEEERTYLERMLLSQDKVMILCEVEGELAGNCQIERKTKQKNRHRAMIGIALFKKYWGLGIGTEMFKELIRIGNEMGVEQLELEVIEGNTRAMKLYEKMGFKVTGEKPNAIRLEDGTRLSEYYMVRVL